MKIIVKNDLKYDDNTNKEKNNLISYCNNKIKNNIEICPLCRETALNNEQIPKIQLIQNKISKLEKESDLILLIKEQNSSETLSSKNEKEKEKRKKKKKKKRMIMKIKILK